MKTITHLQAPHISLFVSFVSVEHYFSQAGLHNSNLNDSLTHFNIEGFRQQRGIKSSLILTVENIPKILFLFVRAS